MAKLVAIVIFSFALGEVFSQPVHELHKKWGVWLAHTDSGSLNQNHERMGEWNEFAFLTQASDQLHPLKLDSLIELDSLFGPLVLSKESGTYELGKRTGEWKRYICYSRDTVQWFLQSTVSYKAGLKEGWEKLRYNRGQTQCEQFYQAGKREGIFRCLNKEGMLVFEQHFKNDTLNGRTIQFDDNGRALFEMMFDKGERVYSKSFNSDGMVTDFHGTQRTFYPNGALKTEGFFEHGAPNGLHKSFYQNGVVEKEVEFFYGSVSGSYKTYYSNGQLKLHAIYKDGKRTSFLECYSVRGKKIPCE